MVQPLSDLAATVGIELALEIRANDPDGDALTFDFAAPMLPDLKTRQDPATIASFADGVAIFRWTPLGADRSETAYAFDFTVSDGKSTSVETVQITVGDSSGSSPVFRKPLGTGTTLDLTMQTCLDVPVLVEDPDSTEVTLEQADPKIAGAELTQEGPFEATWRWCPSRAQIDAQSRYMLALSADDNVSPKTLKSYLIVLRDAPMMNCPGAAPVVTHTAPGPQSTLQDVKVTATISDDKGLKGAPLVYYATTPPADPPVLGQMIQTTMTQISGSATAGTWEAALPNPVAGDPAGTKKSLYYIIIADDDDDATGKCDHSTKAPATGHYAVEVTNPGMTMPGLGVCETCSADSQCGNPGDNCINIGGGTFCSRLCGGSNPRCPNGYHCSTANITSVNGVSSRQCEPVSGTCGPPIMACIDDMYEPNDSTDIANMAAAMMAPGTYSNLAFCPNMTGAGDDDYYKIAGTTSQVVTATMSLLVPKSEYADLDLQLLDKNGASVTSSLGTGDTEMVTGCATYIRVFTFDSAPIKPNLYDLTFTAMPDDAREPNDALPNSQALGLVTGTQKVISDLRICPANEDWFFSYFTAGQKLIVDVEFTGTFSYEDLDVIIYKEDDTAPGGVVQVAAGTASGSNEHVEYTIPAGVSEFYDIVVKGKSAIAENSYTLKVLRQ